MPETDPALIDTLCAQPPFFPRAPYHQADAMRCDRVFAERNLEKFSAPHFCFCMFRATTAGRMMMMTRAALAVTSTRARRRQTPSSLRALVEVDGGLERY